MEAKMQHLLDQVGIGCEWIDCLHCNHRTTASSLMIRDLLPVVPSCAPVSNHVFCKSGGSGGHPAASIDLVNRWAGDAQDTVMTIDGVPITVVSVHGEDSKGWDAAVTWEDVLSLGEQQRMVCWAHTARS